MTETKKKRRSFCSFISVFSALCIGFATVAPTYANAADNTIYVSDIKIYECEDDDGSGEAAKKWFEANGYVFTGIDLNKGTDTDECAYLGYQPTTNKDMAITDIRMMAMDTGYTIYNYKDMADYIASQKAGTAQTLQNAAVLFAQNYKAGSPKAKDAYEGLNLFHVGDASKTKLGDYILAGKTSVRFFTEMIIKSSTGTLNAVHGFLNNGIAPYNNDLDEEGKVITTNWAEFTVKSELWSKIGSDGLSTDERNELHKKYSDPARDLFRTVQNFTTYYEDAKAKEHEKNALPGGDTMEKAAAEMENIEREDCGFLYLAAYDMLNAYEFDNGEKLGDRLITLGRINSDNIDLTQLYPVVEAMGKCQAAIANTGGFISAVLNLADNEHNADFSDAVNEAKDKIEKLTNEEAFNIWENCDGDLENSVIAFTSDDVRKSTAENALGRKSNWEKKKELVQEIEKVVNLAMGVMFVVVPVMTFVLSMAVVVTKMMAATCIAIAALNTMCIWMLAVAQFLTAAMPYIGLIVLVATITAAVAIYVKEYVMGEQVHIDKQSEKPDIIFDAKDTKDETIDIKYKSVKNNRGEVSDINCGCQVCWCLIAYTTDEYAGSPIRADSAGNIFKAVNGSASALNGYDCVRFFGERSAADFNAYCSDNDVNGIYLHYRTEASIDGENVNPTPSAPSGNASGEEINYIGDIIVCTGKNTSEAKAKITRHSGKYYIYDYNLSPDCSQATYIGYTMTTERKNAITDLRVATYVGVSQSTDNIMLGEITYSRVDILGTYVSVGEEQTKPQADCLYFTRDEKAGEPILADGLHAVTSAADIKNGWEPVAVFSGMPYDFNTALINDDFADPTEVAWLEKQTPTTVSGYCSEEDRTDALNSHRVVNVYTESDVIYTSGTKYLSGIFFIGGYDEFDNSWTHSEKEQYVADFKDYMKKQYRVGVNDVNLLQSLYVAKYVCWNHMQSYLCYTWSYSPKRALYNIEAYQGDNHSVALSYTMTKVNDNGISQNYVSAAALYQQSFRQGNARFIRSANNYVNAFGSGIGCYNFEKCIYEDGCTNRLPDNIRFGYSKIQFLPTGLYVTGYATGGRALTLDDVVFSQTRYDADGESGVLSVDLSSEKTLGGNYAKGAFHGVSEMKDPRNVMPFNLCAPAYFYKGEFRAAGSAFYIYLSRTKLAKQKYISSLSVGSYSREEYKKTNPKATKDELKYVDLMVEGNAMAAAAAGCADEVIVVNFATDSQSDAWYNRHKGGISTTEAAADKPAAYIGVTRTDAGTASEGGVSSKARPITGVLLYNLNDTTAPGVIEIDSVQYYCAAVSTPIMMNGAKYYLYYSYSKGAFPGEPIEEIVIDNIPIISGYATNVCADKNSKTPYGNPDQTNFIHVKYATDQRHDFFNKIYIGQGNTEREAKCDLLSHGCLEYLEMDAGFGVKGQSIYIGFRRGRIDYDKINKKETESDKAKELQKQLQEAIYDIIITDDEPYHEDGIVRNNIFYQPVGRSDLTRGMGHRLYMYYASPWYSSRYNTNTGASTLPPQDVFSGYLTQFALAQYDRVPYNNSVVGTTDTENSVKPWEYVMLADHSRPADLNEGTIAFKVDGDTARYAYDNRITMFVQRSDGSVKPAAEITGGFVSKNVTVGSGYINTSGAAGANFTGGTVALACVPALMLVLIVAALVYKKKKSSSEKEG